MSRIYASLIVIMALIVSVGGSTVAAFTQSKQILGSTISTARIDIDLRALSSGEIPKPLNVTGLIPGEWTDWARGEVYNSSLSTPIKVYFYVTNMSGSACSKTNFYLTTGHAGGDERAIVLYDGDINGVAGSENRIEITGAGHIFNPVLPVNTTAVVQQRAQLAADAGDEYQGTSCTWDEVFVAETPEL